MRTLAEAVTIVMWAVAMVLFLALGSMA